MIDRNVLIDRLAAQAEFQGMKGDELRAHRAKLHRMDTVPLADLYKVEIKDDPYSPKAGWKPTAAAA